MKNKIVEKMMMDIFLTTLLVLRVSNSYSQDDRTDFPVMKGPYLGQTPPGLTAELFAPGVVSTRYFEHSSPVFTPDLKEIYWSTQIEENGEDLTKPILYMKMINGIWTKPEFASFAKRWPCTENPFVSVDGTRLYFMASDSIRPEKADIFYVNRINDSWSEPVNIGKPVNSPEEYEGQPSVSENGTIYFLSRSYLVYSRFLNGKYLEPVRMKDNINTGQADWTPYIAPDESYFIFCSFRTGGFGSGDLYICFKQKDGSWGDVINMGDKINTSANERFPNVTPDGKYLFFNSTRKIQGATSDGPGNGAGDIYWIDASIINDLRPK